MQKRFNLDAILSYTPEEEEPKGSKKTMKLSCLSDPTVKFAFSRLGAHKCGYEKCDDLEARCVYRLNEFKSKTFADYWNHETHIETNDELILLLKHVKNNVKSVNAKLHKVVAKQN